MDLSICQNILDEFCNNELKLNYNNSTVTFPRRIKHDLSSDILKNSIANEMKKKGFSINNIRVYKSTYGIVNPHRDVKIDSNNYTCIIYLTEDFFGGRLFIEDQNVIEVKIGNGVIFKKELLHWNDELLSGEKIIILFDCEKIINLSNSDL